MSEAAFVDLLGRCPAAFQDTVRSPPLRSPEEIASYRARLVAHAEAFGTVIPTRAWGPLRDLTIAEVEADRYAGAIGGIVRQSRCAALADLLEEERSTASPAGAGDARATDMRAADIRPACESLARAWIAGAPQAQAEVSARLARLGLTVSVIDDSAHARALPVLTPLERMRANAQRTAARNRKLVEIMLEHEKAADRAKLELGPEKVGSTDKDKHEVGS